MATTPLKKYLGALGKPCAIVIVSFDGEPVVSILESKYMDIAIEELIKETFDDYKRYGSRTKDYISLYANYGSHNHTLTIQLVGVTIDYTEIDKILVKDT